MSAVARIDSDVFQRFALRAYVVVLLGYVGELLDGIEITRPIICWCVGGVANQSSIYGAFWDVIEL